MIEVHGNQKGNDNGGGDGVGVDGNSGDGGVWVCALVIALLFEDGGSIYFNLVFEDATHT